MSGRSFIRFLLASIVSMSTSCQMSGKGQVHRSVTASITVPCTEIDFSGPSSALDNTIVLTFDDGPDEVNTPKVLDILKQNNVKATFFINTANGGNVVNANPNLMNVVRRILSEGHELGNHTVHHYHLPTLSADEVESEIRNVEITLRAIMGVSSRLTLIRAPFGEPFQTPSNFATYQLVKGIVQNHGVHIGWNIDTQDYNCPQTNPDCVVSAFKTPVESGKRGIVLMHSIHPQTAAALPDIIQYVKSKNLVFGRTEDVVRARCGKPSAELTVCN